MASRSSKVVDFGTNPKCVWDFLLVLNSNLGAILPHFRVLELLYDECQFFHTHPCSGQNFGNQLVSEN